MPDVFKQPWGWGVGSGWIEEEKEEIVWDAVRGNGGLICWTFRHCMDFGLYSERGGMALEDLKE